MTMKKLFLTTALALCLASPCFAQDGGDGDAGTKTAQQTDSGTVQPQPDEDLTERPIPAGFQPNGDNDEATWSSVWSKSTSVDGNCVWHVRTTVKYKDPNRLDDWNEYSVKVPCEPESALRDRRQHAADRVHRSAERNRIVERRSRPDVAPAVRPAGP